MRPPDEQAPGQQLTAEATAGETAAAADDPTPVQDDPQERNESVWSEIVETLVLTAVIFIAVNAMTARFKIDGPSMQDTFQTGQYILVSRISYLWSSPQRGDVVVFVPPGEQPACLYCRLLGVPGETDYIKRVIGVPGDTVEILNGNLVINGQLIYEPYIHNRMANDGFQSWELGPDEYFVMGDNRNRSEDSRLEKIGPFSETRVVGKVLAIYFPFSDIGLVNHYNYPEFEN